jgi:hypothetical protein
MADVVACLAINGHNMLVVEGIEDASAIPSGTDNIKIPHLPELMGHGGLADANSGAEIADAELHGIERGHDAKPGRIGHETEERRDLSEVIQCGLGYPRLADSLEMNDAFVAVVLGKGSKLILFSRSSHIQTSPQLYMNSYSGVYMS